MGDYPRRVRVGSGPGAEYEHCPDYHCVRRPAGRGRDGAAAVLADDATHEYAIFEGAPAPEGEVAAAVYRAGKGGPLAVATGRLYVRLAEGARMEDRRAEFEKLGFDVESGPAYAPHTGWLRARSGGAAAALAALPALGRLPGVVHVEPQMLMQRSPRGR